jgi:hypothetical protein
LSYWLTRARRFRRGGIIDIGAFRFALFNESGMIAIVIELSGGSGMISRPLAVQ